jgi:hypothetical protein
VLQSAGLELQAEAEADRQRDGEDHHVAPVPVDVRQHVDAGRTTMPNITITPPPSTLIGTVSITAPTFGTKPQAIRKIAPMVTTWRLITPVMAIRPTFWLNEVFGRPPNNAGDCGAETVGEGRALDLLVGRLAPGAALGDALSVAHGLDRRDDGHEAHADDDREVELEAPLERHRQGEDCARIADIAEVHLPMISATT